jgi:hypothetical protein
MYQILTINAESILRDNIVVRSRKMSVVLNGFNASCKFVCKFFWLATLHTWEKFLVAPMVTMFSKRSTAHVINLSRSHTLSEYRNSLDPLIQFINMNSVTMTFKGTSYTHAYIPELFPYINYMEEVSGKYKQKEFRNRLGQKDH